MKWSTLWSVEEIAAIFNAWVDEEGIGFLLKLAKERAIDPVVMINVADLASDLTQFRNEEHPVSTAVILSDPDQVRDIIPSGAVRPNCTGSVRELRAVIAGLAGLVDGHTLAYLVDPEGVWSDIVNIGALEPMPNILLGERSARYMSLTARTDAVAFWVPARGRRVKVFADGTMIGKYEYGDWQVQALPDLEEVTTSLVHESGLSHALVRRVLHCALQMGEQNLGALFVIGNAERVLTLSDPLVHSASVGIAPVALDKLTDSELITFARQDGATVIDEEGEFRACMVMLRPHPATIADITLGYGARHTSAAKMSAEADCVTVVVSQDGPITAFHRGQQVLRL